MEREARNGTRGSSELGAAVVSALIRAAREVWGLFVEDGSFTIGIMICVALAIGLLPRVALPSPWRGPALFAALAAMLLENVARTARK